MTYGSQAEKLVQGKKLMQASTKKNPQPENTTTDKNLLFKIKS